MKLKFFVLIETSQKKGWGEDKKRKNKKVKGVMIGAKLRVNELILLHMCISASLLLIVHKLLNEF